MPTIKSLSLPVVALGLAFAATPASAWHGHVSHVQGRFGRGYTHDRFVSRAPGSVSVHRGTQTNSGYSISTDRNANWANGTYNGSVTHRLNNGDSFGRTSSLTRNADGTASYSISRTDRDGQSRTRSGTIDRHD
jgi:hypothetical protein